MVKKFKCSFYFNFVAMAKTKHITVQDVQVRFYSQRDDDFISLTDIARKADNERTDQVIGNWLRNRNTVEFLGVWETLHNPNFNPLEFEGIRNQTGLSTFVLTAKRWVESTGAVGITAKAGRYGGTYAHKDIAFEFCSWLSPAFKLYLIKEFQRLKEEELQDRQDALEWNFKRILSKINYSVHTDAIKETLIPPRLAQSKATGLIYATEADILNLALFGVTAKEWRAQNPEAKGNIRDHASTEQLLVLANLEAINAELIRHGLSQDERVVRLNEAAITQMRSILNSPSISRLPPPEK